MGFLRRWHAWSVTKEPARTPESLEEALRRAEEALAEGGAPRSKDSPARVTHAFAHVLDNLVRVPGTNFRFGVDPLLSFIPGAGTVIGAAFGSVVLVDAVRLRAPVPVLARMVGNYLWDWLLGLVPFLGGLLDMAYRSNAKNLKLLNRTIENREQVRRASVTYWVSVAVIAATVLVVVLGVPVALLIWLDALVTG